MPSAVFCVFMSTVGTKRTCLSRHLMSAVEVTADEGRALFDFRRTHQETARVMKLRTTGEVSPRR